MTNYEKSYHGVSLGEFSSTKENFWFSMDSRRGRLIFVRQSETALKKIIKELGREGEIMSRDKSYWHMNQTCFNTKIYKPKY